MKPHTIPASLLALALPVAAVAMAADSNGDGVLTLDEVQAAMPEITIEAFSAMDVNADGLLDADEVAAAQAAGLMPPTEG
jgi:hypothetical protein